MFTRMIVIDVVFGCLPLRTPSVDPESMLQSAIRVPQTKWLSSRRNGYLLAFSAPDDMQNLVALTNNSSISRGYLTSRYHARLAHTNGLFINSSQQTDFFHSARFKAIQSTSNPILRLNPFIPSHLPSSPLIVHHQSPAIAIQPLLPSSPPTGTTAPTNPKPTKPSRFKSNQEM